METINNFNKRLTEKLPYKEHSVRCQLRMDNKMFVDHYFCGCECHG